MVFDRSSALRCSSAAPVSTGRCGGRAALRSSRRATLYNAARLRRRHRRGGDGAQQTPTAADAAALVLARSHLELYRARADADGSCRRRATRSAPSEPRARSRATSVDLLVGLGSRCSSRTSSVRRPSCSIAALEPRRAWLPIARSMAAARLVGDGARPRGAEPPARSPRARVRSASRDAHGRASFARPRQRRRPTTGWRCRRARRRRCRWARGTPRLPAGSAPARRPDTVDALRADLDRSGDSQALIPGSRPRTRRPIRRTRRSAVCGA